MQDSPVVLIAEDDEGHAILIRQTLQEAGLGNRIHHFTDGQAILDFLFRRGVGTQREAKQSYVLLLDIRMPKVNGVEVLRQLKAHDELRKLPVIMLTTTDDPREVMRCHELGCSVYIQKPVDYDKFSEAIRRLGLFMMLLLVPPVNGGKRISPNGHERTPMEGGRISTERGLQPASASGFARRKKRQAGRQMSFLTHASHRADHPCRR